MTPGMCLFRVTDRGKSEARLPSSRDQRHRACMDGATEHRESLISVDRFVKDRWFVARSVRCEGTQHRWIAGNLVNEVILSDVQTLVVKFNQEVKVDQAVSIGDVRRSLMGELHSVEGSIGVQAKMLVSASAANAAIGKNVCEKQCVVRSLDAYIEAVCSTAFDSESAILAWTAEVVGRVVGRPQSGVSEEWTACERR